MIFNVLDWAAGSIPISFVRPSEVDLTVGGNKTENKAKYPDAYPGTLYESGYDDKVDKLSKQCLDSTAIGLPVGVQFASYGNGSEERILRFM